MDKPEVEKKPITFEIHVNKLGEPYLKKAERRRNIREEGRGSWMPIGKATDLNIYRVIEANESNGILVLPDEDGNYRALVLTD